MAKSAILHARIDGELKNNAEKIFEQLGLTSADAIKLFYKQVELTGGLPFEIKLPNKILAEAKLFEELEKGENSAKDRWLSLEESKKELGL